MQVLISAPLYVGAWLVAMLLAMEVGRRLGRRRLARHPSSGAAGTGAIEGAVFALAGLLIAFTFSGGASRLDSRRALIAEEANEIGTAYLRIDMLPPASQPELRQLFRDYLDARLDVYKKLPDLEAAKAKLRESEEIQGKIWTSVLESSQEPGGHPDAAKLMIPAINSMFDITTTRTMAAYTHPPPVLYVLLFLVTLGAAILAGYGMAGNEVRDWVHIVAFSLLMSICLFVILDMEYPRAGFISLTSYDEVLIQLRQKMQ
jgi:hypothetical protein